MIPHVSSAIIRKTTPPGPSAHPVLANDYWLGEIEIVSKSKPYTLMYLHVRIDSGLIALF